MMHNILSSLINYWYEYKINETHAFASIINAKTVLEK